MAMAMATAMADGNATEMAAAMGNGDHNGSGQRQWQWQWATAMATVTATATAMATETVMVIAMAKATARTTIMKGGLPLHVPAMCSAVAAVTPCLHPNGHKGVCIHQHCIIGVMLQRVFAPFQRGEFLTAHHLLFILFYITAVHFTEQPSVCPLHYSGTQELCQPIDALPLLLLFHIFAKVSLGVALIVPLQLAALWQG